MWQVEFESPSVEKEIEAFIKCRKLSSEDRLVVSTWIRQVGLKGSESVLGDKRWDDHEFYDEWKGYRASCFSSSGRIIYRVEDKVIKILIARITPDHDYRLRRK